MRQPPATALLRPMRVLAIETSCLRGSVALVEAGTVVAEGSHSRANAHGESIQPLIEAALAEAGWARSRLDRVAVGVGPGSFTGLRVGIALALGIGEGLGIEVVGVGSMAAMAAAAPASAGLRCAVLDARRDEVFAAAYTQAGQQSLEPVALPRDTALSWLRARLPEEPCWVGAGCTLVGVEARPWPGSDLPSARWTAQLGAEATGGGELVRPNYVRNDVAVRPWLPPNPLGSPR